MTFLIVTITLATTFVLLIVLGYIFLRLAGMSFSDNSDAPYVVSPKTVADNIIRIAHVKKGMKILELGCGEAKILRRIVRQTEAVGRGVDVNKVMIFLANIFSFFDGTSEKISYTNENILKADIAWADVIYLFMTREFVNSELFRKKVLETALPGTVIVSHWFELSYLKSNEIEVVKCGKHATYFYKIDS